jgi:transposase
MTQQSSSVNAKVTIGIDLGDRRSRVYALDEGGACIHEGWVHAGRAAWEAFLARFPGARVVMEAGTHSPWVSRLAKSMGHDVVVGNPSEIYGRKRRKRRNDTLDAEQLARMGRVDPALLSPIQHRGEQAQLDLAALQSRDMLVKSRTKLINHVRGSVKAVGGRLPACSAEAFVAHVSQDIPESLEPALGPVLRQITALTEEVRGLDRTVERRAKDAYPETRRLRQIKGVGPLTSLCYVLVLEEPKRFKNPRDTGTYIGLVPRLDETGESQPQLPITKAGNQLLRTYLVQSAQYILGPFGSDSDLRRWGLSLMTRGGKNAKKRAVIAVARKLAVLLHRLWETGAPYVPLRTEQNSLSRAG